MGREGNEGTKGDGRLTVGTAGPVEEEPRWMRPQEVQERNGLSRHWAERRWPRTVSEGGGGRSREADRKDDQRRTNGMGGTPMAAKGRYRVA